MHRRYGYGLRVRSVVAHRQRVVHIDFPLQLRHTCGLHARGNGDPTMRVAAATLVRSTRFGSGATSMRVAIGSGRVEAEAWGPGAEQALEELPDLIGAHDRPELLQPRHPVISELQRRTPGLRIGRTHRVFEAAVPAVLEQKITGNEAWRVFRNLVRTYGEPAPGPLGLWLQPSPEILSQLSYFDLHAIGLERRRAGVIRELARRAPRLERTVRSQPVETDRILAALPGIGPWTRAEVALRASGDPDAVSVGDYHLPSLVSWVLAGEPNGTDERMLELLDEYAGQRGRVVRLLELHGPRVARRGPRMQPRRLETI